MPLCRLLLSVLLYPPLLLFYLCVLFCVIASSLGSILIYQFLQIPKLICHPRSHIPYLSRLQFGAREGGCCFCQGLFGNDYSCVVLYPVFTNLTESLGPYGLELRDAAMIREMIGLLEVAGEDIRRHLRQQIRLLRPAAKATTKRALGWGLKVR